VEVCPIQLPGREDRIREASFKHLSPLIQVLTGTIRPYLNIPFALFGHSMGGLIGFELARHLRTQCDPEPTHLFISGRQAPQIRDRHPRLHTLPESEFLQEIRCLNGTPQSVLSNVELMQLLLPILRADFSICGTYTYIDEPPLNCPITVFGGTDDPEAPAEVLAGWSTQTLATFSLQMLPGDHFFLHDSQSLLLEMLSRQLYGYCHCG
jgi:medium-chain acyl-[acyl-carrier-protein] hydrolase